MILVVFYRSIRFQASLFQRKLLDSMGTQSATFIVETPKII